MDNKKELFPKKTKDKGIEIIKEAGPIEFEVKYEAGHSYKELWEHTDLHCPSCGEKNVWVDMSEGDYYEGPEHICTKCETTFSMPRKEKASDYQDKQRLEAIRKWE